MNDIITKHSPWSYTQTQIDAMLYVHAHLPDKTVTYVYQEPDGECGDECKRCARDREAS